MYLSRTAKMHLVNLFAILSKKRALSLSLFSFLLSTLIISYYTHYHIHHQSVPFYDIDGWGHLVGKMMETGKSWSLLTEAGSLSRGFLVPFIYGLSYAFLKVPESVQVLNILLQSFSSAILTYWFSVNYGIPLVGFAIGFIWACWPPFSSIYGYYFTEPLAGLISIMLWLLVPFFLQKPKRSLAILVGVLLALSLHVRPASILVVAGLLILFSTRWRYNTHALLPAIFLSFSIAYLPLPIYNYLVTKHFIPFTTGGGWVLHHGTYIPGDDHYYTFKSIPEFQEREAEAEEMDPVTRDKYYQAIAFQQIKADPVGQIRLLAKKLLRFWYYIPPFEWIPTVKTLLVMTPLLVLAILGLLKNFSDIVNQVGLLIIAGYWVLYGIMHSELRYHFPIFPILLYLAYQGIVCIFSKLSLTERAKLSNS